MQLREEVEMKIEELKLQTYNLNFERYCALYRDDTTPYTADGQEIEGQPVTDPAYLDQWFESLAGLKGMTGAQVEGMFEETRRRV